MKKVILLAMLAAASAAWAQDAKNDENEAKPAAQAEQKPAAEKPRPSPVAKKFTQRRFMDARHCLEKGSNTEIIKCAEAYL